MQRMQARQRLHRLRQTLHPFAPIQIKRVQALHYCRSGHRPSYSQRHCTLCSGGVLGDETHIITGCPYLNSIFHQHTLPFRVLFRLCDLVSFDSLSPQDRLRAMLGKLPPGMLIRNMPVWISEAPSRCTRFAYDLQIYISVNAPSLTTCPSSDSDESSDSEEVDLYEPITPPLTSR